MKNVSSCGNCKALECEIPIRCLLGHEVQKYYKYQKGRRISDYRPRLGYCEKPITFKELNHYLVDKHLEAGQS